MPNFKSISFKMAVLQGAGRICPPHVWVIQKTPCGVGLTNIPTEIAEQHKKRLIQNIFLKCERIHKNKTQSFI